MKDFRKCFSSLDRKCNLGFSVLEGEALLRILLMCLILSLRLVVGERNG